MAYTFDKVYAAVDLLCMVTELRKTSYSVQFLAKRWQWGHNRVQTFLIELQRNEFGEFQADNMFHVFAGINKNFRVLGVTPPKGVYPWTSEKFMKAWERYKEEKYALGFRLQEGMFIGRSMKNLVEWSAKVTGNPAGDEDEAIRIIENARRTNYVLHDPLFVKARRKVIYHAALKLKDEKIKVKSDFKKKSRNTKKHIKGNG